MTAALTMLAQAGAAATGDQSAWIAAGFILLAAGLVLGVLEIFVPTGGLLAAATATCFVASIVMFFLHGALWGFAALLAYSAGAPFAVVFAFRMWTRTPIARKMVLGDTQAGMPGEEGTAPAPNAPGAVPVGAEGTAETTLRPVGMVRFGELRVESVAEMGMIEAGTAVKVVESTPLRVVVRARG